MVRNRFLIFIAEPFFVLGRMFFEVVHSEFGCPLRSVLWYPSKRMPDGTIRAGRAACARCGMIYPYESRGYAMRIGLWSVAGVSHESRRIPPGFGTD